MTAQDNPLFGIYAWLAAVMVGRSLGLAVLGWLS